MSANYDGMVAMVLDAIFWIAFCVVLTLAVVTLWRGIPLVD
jgi:hypothetical protein